MSIHTSEKYIFLGYGIGYIYGVKNFSGVEFSVSLQRIKEELIEIRKGDINIEQARASLEGFVHADLIQNYPEHLLKDICRAGWSKTFCVEPQ